MGATKRAMALAAAGAGLLLGVQAGAANGPMSGYARLTGVSVELGTVSVAKRVEYTCSVAPSTSLSSLTGERLELADLAGRADGRTAVFFEAQMAGSRCRLERLQIVDGMPQ